MAVQEKCDEKRLRSRRCADISTPTPSVVHASEIKSLGEPPNSQ
jgi:hypothetical protein